MSSGFLELLDFTKIVHILKFKRKFSEMFLFRINVDPLCVGMRMVKGLLAGDNSVAVAAFSTFNFPSK